jgi:hypothetical protein
LTYCIPDGFTGIGVVGGIWFGLLLPSLVAVLTSGKSINKLANRIVSLRMIISKVYFNSV